jgi:hypothetical protein
MITVGPPAMSPVEHALRLGDVNAARVLKGIEASNDRAVNTSSHRRCRAGREDQQVPDPGGLQAQSGLEAGVAGWGCAAASLMRATAGPSRTWPDGQLPTRKTCARVLAGASTCSRTSAPLAMSARLADLAADYRERPEVAACEPRRRVNSPSAAAWRERDLRRPVEAGRPGATVWRP